MLLWCFGFLGYAQTLATPDRLSMDEFEKSVLALISEGKQAEAIDPNWDKIWYNWGVALKGLGRKSEALEKFTKTLQLNPKHSAAGREIKALETP